MGSHQSLLPPAPNGVLAGAMLRVPHKGLEHFAFQGGARPLVLVESATYEEIGTGCISWRCYIPVTFSRETFPVYVLELVVVQSR